MSRTTTTAMTHYEYRASIYRLAREDGEPRAHRRRLAALRSAFAPPVTYGATGSTIDVA